MDHTTLIIDVLSILKQVTTYMTRNPLSWLQAALQWNRPARRRGHITLGTLRALHYLPYLYYAYVYLTPLGSWTAEI